MTADNDVYFARRQRFETAHGSTDWQTWERIYDACEEVCPECALFEEPCTVTGRPCADCATWPIAVGDGTWAWLSVTRAMDRI